MGLEYSVHDALIEDRNGSVFSVWYSLLKGRLWFVEYTVNGYNIQRIDFQEVAL